ncbi:hypothetical protein KI387_003211 [Taxus chinensis]|uniref:Uncharacterized protein n=1 Tax=Taxus chinensis TaxID=29808 RepID=A0AA38GXE9_TAXCH|nr:hypothetical protein KI387_003211 [Taxus chinensis]
MRIAAPKLPYCDVIMEDIFKVMVGSFQGLWDLTSPSFGKRVCILNTMAKVRSCIIMMDLECNDLISHMFEVFFDVISNDHAQEIMISMQAIMSLILNEYESPPTHLLSMLEEGLSQKTSRAAHALAKGVIEQCSNKVKTMILQGMSSFVVDGTFLTSNDCMGLNGCKKSNLDDEHEEGISVKHVYDEKEIMAKELMREKSDIVKRKSRIDNECKDEGMNDRKEEEAFPSTLDHSQLVGPYSTAVHMQRKIVKEEQPRSLLSDQTQASKGQPRVDLNMALKGSISPYLPPHKRQPLYNYIEVINYSKFDLASNNDEVVDGHMHVKKEKSDLKDTIHPHREPFEGQEGSVSLMVTPSHSLHDISIGEGEKGV